MIIVGRAKNETGGSNLSAEIMTEAFRELSPARGNLCNHEPPDSEMKKEGPQLEIEYIRRRVSR